MGLEPLSTPQGPYARYGRRFCAMFLDGWFLLAVSGLAGKGGQTGFETALAWAYCAVLEASPLQATFGKLALGLIVTNDRGERPSIIQASIRYWCRMITLCRVAFYCFLAYVLQMREVGLKVVLEQPFLHDRWAGALVVDAVPGGRALSLGARVVLGGALAASLLVASFLRPAAQVETAPEPPPVAAAPQAPPETAAGTVGIPDSQLTPAQLDERLFSRLLGDCLQEVQTICRETLGDRPKTMACLRAKSAEINDACRQALTTLP